MKDNIYKIRLKVLEKLINNGYDTDRKICNLNIEDFVINNNFNRVELEIIIRLKQALNNKKLISFITGIEEDKR